MDLRSIPTKFATDNVWVGANCPKGFSSCSSTETATLDSSFKRGNPANMRGTYPFRDGLSRKTPKGLAPRRARDRRESFRASPFALTRCVAFNFLFGMRKFFPCQDVNQEKNYVVSSVTNRLRVQIAFQ